jgi:hypothetical protein
MEEVLIFLLGTFVTSYGITIKCELGKYKDAADNGYKIEIGRLSEINNQVNHGDQKNPLISFLIRGLNIFKALDTLIKHINSRPFSLDLLRVMGALSPMTKEEQRRYNQNPSGMTAFRICCKSLKENAPSSISYIENKKKNIIWYRDINKNDGSTRSRIPSTYVIVKTKGPVSDLPIMEQREMLNKKIEEEKAEVVRLLKGIIKDLENYLLEDESKTTTNQRQKARKFKTRKTNDQTI